MPQFIHPLEDHILTRDFYYKSDIYVGGQHAAGDYIREKGRTRDSQISAVAEGIGDGNGWDSLSGNYVAVRHADGFRSIYRHLLRRSLLGVGQRVIQGEAVGHVGNTGLSQGDHLHFDLWNCDEIRDDDAIFYKKGWYAVDPELYLGKEEEDSMAGPTHQQILENLWARMASIETQFGGHVQGHQETLDPNIRTLNDRVKNLEARSAGGGVSENRVKALIRAARLSV